MLSVRPSAQHRALKAWATNCQMQRHLGYATDHAARQRAAAAAMVGRFLARRMGPRGVLVARAWGSWQGCLRRHKAALDARRRLLGSLARWAARAAAAAAGRRRFRRASRRPGGRRW